MSGARSILGLFVRDRSGSTAVEFALILPIFLLTMLGIVEFGRMIWIRNSMEYAAEYAARWGGINTSKTDAEIEAQALTYLIEVNPGTVTFSSVSSSASVSVTATQNFTLLTTGLFNISPITLTVTSQFPR